MTNDIFAEVQEKFGLLNDKEQYEVLLDALKSRKLAFNTLMTSYVYFLQSETDMYRQRENSLVSMIGNVYSPSRLSNSQVGRELLLA